MALPVSTTYQSKYPSREDHFLFLGMVVPQGGGCGALNLKATQRPMLFTLGRELPGLPWREDGPSSLSNFPSEELGPSSLQENFLEEVAL